MKYKDSNEMLNRFGEWQLYGYKEGVDWVIRYIQSTNAYPKLVEELEWAIKEGII